MSEAESSAKFPPKFQAENQRHSAFRAPPYRDGNGKIPQTEILTEKSKKDLVSHVTPSYESDFEILRRAAGVSDWGYGVWGYDKWAEFNTRFFTDRLKVGGIFWGLTPHGKTLGFYSPDRNAITLHTSLVKPSGNAWHKATLLGERFAEDVLLHEMMHQANLQIDGTCRVKGEPHNQPLWCALINDIIPKLGLETDLKAAVVKQRRVNGRVSWEPRPGFMSRIQLATFPHTLRPRCYYETETLELLNRITGE